MLPCGAAVTPASLPAALLPNPLHARHEPPMKSLSYIGLAVGVVIMIGLLLWQGFGQVLHLLLQSGWGLLWLPLVWLPCIVPATLSWRRLFVPEHRPRFLPALKALWIGRAVNTLLPVATIGGELVKARLLTLWGTPGSHASASVVVDKTVQVLALIVWGVVGAGLLVYLVAGVDLALWVLGGLLLLGLGVIGFVAVQSSGMFGFLARMSGMVLDGERAARLDHHASRADRIVAELYRSPGNIAWAVALRTLGLIWQTTEVWLAAYLLGYPVSLLEALMLKSMSGTLSDVAFIVPNSYGVQEGAFMALGALLGIPVDVMLAVSLATRIRDVAVDVPGLLAWQHTEARVLLFR